MEILINLLLSGIAVLISAYILPGVKVDGFVTALAVAILLAVVNLFIKPLVLFLTFPINILTLGLFTFVINALMVLIVSSIVPGFKVDGILWAIVFSIVLSLVSSAIFMFAPKKK
ncbi:MAG TPA: phage holin family protein [Candidatus Saccharimonadales bacterium]|nr:phage holin family protein [Candidatus Saccharimonadales bacterium]